MKGIVLVTFVAILVGVLLWLFIRSKAGDYKWVVDLIFLVLLAIVVVNVAPIIFESVSKALSEGIASVFRRFLG